MLYSQKTKKVINLSLLLFFVFNLAYAYETPQPLDGDLDAYTSELYEETNKEYLATQDPLSKALIVSTAPLVVPAGSFFTKMNSVIEFLLTLFILLLLVFILIKSQIYFIKIWIFLIKSIIKGYVILKIIGASSKNVPDLIELFSKEGKEISNSIKSKLNKKSEGTIRLVTKLSAILQHI